MALRRGDGFSRFAVSLQYHGGSFLGFTYQKGREDTILADGTDFRGYRTVEGRLRDGLDELLPNQWENFQVSSRTDRGVHALKNTFHVDIAMNESPITQKPFSMTDVLHKLHRGLNFYLSKQTAFRNYDGNDAVAPRNKKRRRKRRPAEESYSMLGEDWCRYSNDEIKILSALKAPEYMDNPYSEIDTTQPNTVDWNARFSATERTYIYRILYFSERGDDDWGVPFEWDRSWRVRGDAPIDVLGMQQAAKHLEGTHDFTTFRGANCQRNSPIVTLRSVQVKAQSYASPWMNGGLLGFGNDEIDQNNTPGSISPQLITIRITGNSFLYRQVRNLVGCLLDVGKGKIPADAIPDLLAMKNRSAAPTMAASHGLFLVDVQHGRFKI